MYGSYGSMCMFIGQSTYNRGIVTLTARHIVLAHPIKGNKHFFKLLHCLACFGKEQEEDGFCMKKIRIVIHAKDTLVQQL